MGQGPRPDLLFEEMQEREERERRMEQSKGRGLSQDCGLRQEPTQDQNASGQRQASHAPAVWNQEDSFASRATDIPKPTKKDLLAMIIAMLELMLPIALLFVAAFALLIFFLQKVWLHG